MLNTAEQESLRLAATEALGWYPYSYQKTVILNALNKLMNDKLSSDALKKEALRSSSYLKAFTIATTSNTVSK